MAKRKPKPGPKPPKYSWVRTPFEVKCFADPEGGQTVSALWETDTLSNFHDQALASATKEINGILQRLERSKPNDEVELGFIEFQDRLLLVWSSYDVVSPHDDDEEIIKALGLKTSNYAQSR